MSMAARNEIWRSPARRARVAWHFCAVAGFCALSIAPAWAQAPPEWSQVLERLDRLETQNRELTAEVRALRSELAAAHGGQPDEEPPVASSN